MGRVKVCASKNCRNCKFSFSNDLLRSTVIDVLITAYIVQSFDGKNFDKLNSLSFAGIQIAAEENFER